ncbi:hypothetical protein [Actibacterium sp. 188UL27-1]|uniref:hypothetical protein n=1 Tax=Actibacterium sp. 188UL27-1 TaxID=2786961 RepID=UPI00195D7010|nr:hypothetical protein [Actibacterium sp. 188UL27-1]MBM7067339.1 hypothetical protein [Actibacterium sp. 188UL27-1]
MLFRVLSAAFLALPLHAAAQRQAAVVPAEIQAFGGAQYGDLYTGATVYEGDFTGDGAPDALAFIFRLMGAGGNGVITEAQLFTRVEGRLVHSGTVEGMEAGFPQRIHSWQIGRIEIEMLVYLQGDAKCCPMGRQIYSIIPPG